MNFVTKYEHLKNHMKSRMQNDDKFLGLNVLKIWKLTYAVLMALISWNRAGSELVSS